MAEICGRDGGLNMLNKLRDDIHKNAKKHGWWDEDRAFGEIIALCHSELSEALEEYRNGHKAQEVYCGNADLVLCDMDFVASQRCHRHHCTGYKPEGIPIELADCIIRILDYCGKEGIDIQEAILTKHKHNQTRPYKHGGKQI